MRAHRFRPAFDHLCTRITPSDAGVASAGAIAPPTVDGGTMPGEDVQIPVSYADPAPSAQPDVYLNPPIPINYAM